MEQEKLVGEIFWLLCGLLAKIGFLFFEGVYYKGFIKNSVKDIWNVTVATLVKMSSFLLMSGKNHAEISIVTAYRISLSEFVIKTVFYKVTHNIWALS